LDADGEIVGTGYHQSKGEPHAEGYAAAAESRAAGGTAVVTLEPCNHLGRTPACRQLLLDAKAARVVIALIDPTSRGEGGGAALRAAGVDVEVGVPADEARLVLGLWLAALEARRPFVTAAYAIGADGSQRLDEVVLAELGATVDAVLFEDGRVEEAVAGSHGQGAFELPVGPVVGTPGDVLKASRGRAGR
jgi:diaminohydroxyphosphoribosylaminopyrimidine deaminase/5-amino-6-(5-phosphoribosylamino)uracil reductase